MISTSDTALFSPLSASADSLIYLAQVLGPPVGVIIAASWLGFGSRHPRYRKFGVYYFVAFAVTGVVVGFTTGMSREPAVAALVPASISLLGGMAAVALGRSRVSAMLSVVAMAIFSIGLAHGVMVGAKARYAFESQQTSLSARMNALEENDRLEVYRRTLEQVREIEQEAME